MINFCDEGTRVAIYALDVLKDDVSWTSKLKDMHPGQRVLLHHDRTNDIELYAKMLESRDCNGHSQYVFVKKCYSTVTFTYTSTCFIITDD